MCQYHVFTHETVSNEDFAVSGIPAPDPGDTKEFSTMNQAERCGYGLLTGCFKPKLIC